MQRLRHAPEAAEAPAATIPITSTGRRVPDVTGFQRALPSVIDNLTRALACAYHLMITLDPSDERVHTAWYRLAELADGDTDLSAKVNCNARRLPVLGDRC
ncbi:hypothetical protein [Nocardia rhizosphaerihabitans]|uniref:Uncharacterized protein n=1 Tax=Nocardia rhizosphaerihabitans TaxID=1691570 RepID=A0ABQ2KCQ0_9NOCA|nr:hypothetical protein [Nocardia rhizosphaerihabitans]GGN78508.1 hypothetical protein GCM10011610_26100 [Nocardia rhizosphaerihabitans]